MAKGRDYHDHSPDNLTLEGSLARIAPKGGKGQFICGIFIFLCLAAAIGAFAVPTSVVDLGIGKVVIAGAAGLFGLAATVILAYMSMYWAATTDLAFVRTGGLFNKKKQTVIIDGGCLVVGFLHRVTPVSLNAMTVPVNKGGKEALITGNRMRADIKTTFFLKIQKEADAIAQAASSLGTRSCDRAQLKEFVTLIVEGSLRDVAAEQTLQQLNANREDFAKKVKSSVEADLAKNGLQLDSVTIIDLDQSPIDPEKAKHNVFDSEGEREAAVIIAENRIKANDARARADEEIAERDAQRAKKLAEQTVIEAKAKAEADANSAIAEAEAAQRAATVKAEQDKIAGEALAQSEREIGIANVEKDRAVQVASVQQQREVEIKTVEKNQAAEVAKRQKEIAIADAEKSRAAAQTAQLQAENDRKSAEEAVKTTEAVAKAERDQEVAVVNERAEAEKVKIKDQMAADVKAYEAVKEAEGEQAAADQLAQATRTKAQAEKDAALAKAEGDQAVAMVPVEVKAKEVEVNEAQVKVDIELLEAKEKNKASAIELEKALASIAADKDARIAFATALGEAYKGADMTIYGDPATLARMSKAFMNGQAVSNTIDGTLSELPEPIKEALAMLTPEMMGLLGKLIPGKGEAEAETGTAEKAHDDADTALVGADRLTGSDLLSDGATDTPPKRRRPRGGSDDSRSA